MRAVLFDAAAPDARATRVGEVPVPEPGPGEVTIDVVAAGINFIDVMARRDDPGYVGAWPFVPGLEAAGTVRALGAGVTGLAPGDRVAAFTGSGGLAEVAVASAGLVAPVPDGVAWTAAAAAGGALATAILLVEDVARLRAGETLVVHSAGGGVGQALAQVARAAGAATVIGTVGRPERADAALAAGYDAALVRDDRLAVAVRDLTGDRGADVVLDPQGTALLDADLEIAAPGVRIVLFGNAAGSPLDPLPAPGRLFALNASIGAFSLSRMARQLPTRLGAALSRALAALADCTLAVDPIEIPDLDAVAAVHEELATGRGAGKRVVVLGRSPGD